MSLEPAPTRDNITSGDSLTVLWSTWFNKIKSLIDNLLDRVTTNEAAISTLQTDLTNAVVVYTATFNPSTVNAQTTSEQTATVTGLLTTDYILAVIKPTHTSGINIGNARVSATNTAAVTFINPTAGNIDPPSETYTFVISRV